MLKYASKTTRGQIRFTIFTGTKNKFFYNIIFLHTSSSPVLSFVLMWLYLEAIKETVPTLNCARQGKGVSLAAGEQSEQNLTLGHICMRFCGPVFSLSPPPPPFSINDKQLPWFQIHFSAELRTFKTEVNPVTTRPPADPSVNNANNKSTM